MGHIGNWHKGSCEPPGSLTYLHRSPLTNTMGTRSRIGYELPDHSVVSVYCHWDGGIEGNGKILVEHYQNREDVMDLIDGGSMSSLRTRSTWTTGSALRDDAGEYITDDNGYLMYENDREPQPLYHSERGDGEEPWHSSFNDFVAGHSCEEYAYLYDLNGNWKAFKLDSIVEPIEIPSCVTA